MRKSQVAMIPAPSRAAVLTVTYAKRLFLPKVETSKRRNRSLQPPARVSEPELRVRALLPNVTDGLGQQRGPGRGIGIWADNNVIVVVPPHSQSPTPEHDQ